MRHLILLAASIPTVLRAQPTIGLIEVDPANQDGYVLFAPINSFNTYLIDKCGREVHQWNSAYHPGDAVYLQEDGILLRTGNANNAAFGSGGRGGVLQRLDWNSDVLWEYAISDAQHCQHHDAFPIAGGNVLAVVWEKHTVAEATAAGRNPVFLGTELWSEAVLELQPIGADSAAVVWEWHLWDHLVQEFDALQANYGVVQDHPELVDLNAIGGAPTQADWIHMNAIHYDPLFDRIMLSAHNMNEIWIIDHGTTTAEAASHAGGAYGRGGDLLYRWGDPQVYGRGTPADRVFFGQHNAQWIEAGLPDAGKVLVFNNGAGRPGGDHSTIDRFVPPMDGDGHYIELPGQAFGPAAVEWTWSDDPPEDFFSANISGVQQLANGGYMVCSGASGTFFELDPDGNEVWRYIDPVSQSGPLVQGEAPVMNQVFRCTFVAPAHPGLAGHSLIPGTEIELDPLVPSLCATVALPEQYAADLVVAPNPAADVLHIGALAGGPFLATLTDATGRRVGEWTVVAGADLDLSGIATGAYVLSVDQQGTRARARLLVRH